MIDETDFDVADAARESDSRSQENELRDARDLIVQLQRELERAREVIAQQQASVRRAFRLSDERRES